MKKISIIMFIITFSTFFSQITIPEGYKKIPDSLHFRDNLYQFIVPNIKYKYWQVIRKDDTIVQDLIYESEKHKNDKNSAYSPDKGFFNECKPDWCFSYIIAFRNNKPQYFTNEQELRNFIGYVDNISEALLIARTYGFWFDDKNQVGGSFKISNDSIYMYLARFESCPVTRESFYVKIDRKTGILQYESQGVYYKTNDCYSS